MAKLGLRLWPPGHIFQETISLDGFMWLPRDPALPQALGTENGGSKMDLSVGMGWRRSLSPEGLGSIYKLLSLSTPLSCHSAGSGHQVALL